MIEKDIFSTSAKGSKYGEGLSILEMSIPPFLFIRLTTPTRFELTHSFIDSLIFLAPKIRLYFGLSICIKYV